MEAIQAQLQGTGARLQLLQAVWPSPVNIVAREPEHYLFLYLPPIGFKGEGRFPGFTHSRYRRISPLFFRPADVSLEARGTGGSTRLVRYAVSRSRFAAVLEREMDWTVRQLESALDLDRSSLKPALLQLMHEALQPGLATAALVDALGIGVIVELARHITGEATQKPERGRLSAAQMRLIRDRCDGSLPGIPSVADLAQLCGTSERTLMRLFKKSTGETLFCFVRRSRSDAARHLLADGHLGLKQVAHRLGFATHSSFSAAFHRDIGFTPAEFRRRLGRNYD